VWIIKINAAAGIKQGQKLKHLWLLALFKIGLGLLGKDMVTVTYLRKYTHLRHDRYSGTKGTEKSVFTGKVISA
jgi:hypothetical protein